MAQKKRSESRPVRDRVGIEPGEPITWRTPLKPLAEVRASDVPRGFDPDDVSIEHHRFTETRDRDD